MANDKKHYRAYGFSDKLTPGKEMLIKHSIDFDAWNADFSDLVSRSETELESMRQKSVDKETNIYGKLLAGVVQWEEQAGQTLLLERVLEYVRTPEVRHTDNQWKRRTNGDWEISNRVYIMRYRFSPAAFTDKKTGLTVENGYRVDWGIVFNAPEQPPSNHYSDYGDSIYVARQDKKLYPTLEAAQKYIQSRFDLYAHLFEEVSPPIPSENKRFFMVNGQLLPGYSLQSNELDRMQPWEMDKLLDCLEDEDLGAETQEQREDAPSAAEGIPAAPEKSPAKQDTPAEPAKRPQHRPSRKDPVHKKKQVAMAR